MLMGASVTVAAVSGTGKPVFSFDGALCPHPAISCRAEVVLLVQRRS
jgi:hypothetical protein